MTLSTLAPWLDPLAAWLATYWVHSTLLLGAAWCVGRWLRQPAAEEAAWRVAMLAGLVTASVQRALGVSAWTWPTAPSGTPGAASEPSIAAVDPLLVPLMTDSATVGSALIETASPTTALPDATLAVGASGLDSLGGLDVVSNTAASPWAAMLANLPTVSWSVALLGVMALCGSVGSVRLGRAAWRLRRQLRDRVEVDEGSVREILDVLIESLPEGRRTPVRLTRADGLSVPVALGLRRPEIALPPWAFDDLAPTEQRSLLAHELAHWARADTVWRPLASILAVLLPVQPLNALAARRLEVLSEDLADDWSRRCSGGSSLARCLTRAADHLLADRAAPVAAMASPDSDLGRRVRRLLAPASSSGRSLSMSWLVVLVALVGLPVVTLAPGWAAVPEPPPVPSAPEPPEPTVAPDPPAAPAPPAPEAPPRPDDAPAPDAPPAPPTPPSPPDAPLPEGLTVPVAPAAPPAPVVSDRWPEGLTPSVVPTPPAVPFPEGLGAPPAPPSPVVSPTPSVAPHPHVVPDPQVAPSPTAAPHLSVSPLVNVSPLPSAAPLPGVAPLPGAVPAPKVVPLQNVVPAPSSPVVAPTPPSSAGEDGAPVDPEVDPALPEPRVAPTDGEAPTASTEVAPAADPEPAAEPRAMVDGESLPIRHVLVQSVFPEQAGRLGYDWGTARLVLDVDADGHVVGSTALTPPSGVELGFERLAMQLFGSSPRRLLPVTADRPSVENVVARGERPGRVVLQVAFARRGARGVHAAPTGWPEPTAPIEIEEEDNRRDATRSIGRFETIVTPTTRSRDPLT